MLAICEKIAFMGDRTVRAGRCKHMYVLYMKEQLK